MRLWLPGVFAVGLMAAGCGSSTTPTSSSPSAIHSTPTAPSANSTSSVTVALTDSPFTDAKALLVTFSGVSVHASGGDFVTVPFSGGAASRTCDLKKLTAGAQDVLGTGPLSAGHYTQIRLIVSSAVIYFGSASVGPACAPTIAPPAGANASVDIPSGEVKLNREFDLAASGGTTILLDFNGDQSVRQTGNGRYMMTPVIGVVSVH